MLTIDAALLLVLPLLLHRREDGAAHHVGAGDVDAQDAVEVLGRHAVEVALVLELGGAGVVYEAVDPAPLLQGLGGELPAIGVLAHVGLHQDRLDALGLDRLVGLVGFLLALGVVDGDVPAALRQVDRARGAEPRRRARHDRHLARFRHVSLRICPPAFHRLGSGPKAKRAGHGQGHGRSVFDEEPRGAADRRLARAGPRHGHDPGRRRRHGAVRRPHGERAGGDGTRHQAQRRQGRGHAARHHR